MMSGNRPSVHNTLMGCADLWARRSTCSRLHVGAVFARGQRILGTGYNGAPAGLPHCDHPCTCDELMKKTSIISRAPSVHLAGCRSQEPCLTSEHAERNGIAWAARNGIALEGSHLYVTHMPCYSCSMSIVNAGVVRVIYRETYRDHSGVDLLLKAGVGVVQLTTSTPF